MNFKMIFNTLGRILLIEAALLLIPFILSFVYAAWKQESIAELKEMITAVIGALSGLIGFVIGYYFKTKD